METFKFTVQDFQFQKSLAVVGFEPTPPRRLVPKTSALDRSATLPDVDGRALIAWEL